MLTDRPTLVFYRALLVLQLVWALVTVSLIAGKSPITIFSGQSDFWLSLLLLFVPAFGAYAIDRSRANQAQRWRFDERGKRLHYRHTIYIRSALLEAGNLTVLMIALLSRRWEIFALVLPGLMLYWYFRPRAQELEERYR
ncbi:MAG: hypothetical protein AAF433_03345 [Bacteroidota bacterium]